MPPFWLSVAVACACLIAIFELPYGFFQFLRLVVTGYAGYMAFAYFRTGRSSVGWAFAFIALIFNPLFVIAMSKGMHALFDLMTAGLVLGELAILRQRKSANLPLEAASGQELPSPALPDDERVELAKYIVGQVVTAVGAIILLGIILAVALKWAEHSRPKREAEVWPNPSTSDEDWVTSKLPLVDSLPPSFQDNAPIETPLAAKPILPKFEEYAVMTSVESTPLLLEPGTPNWAYRARIRNGYAGAANFAENGVITVWGCGTGCSAGVFIDRTTGEVHELPLGGEMHRYLKLSSQSASRLLLGNWEESYGAETTCVFDAYTWDGSEFVSVSGYPIRATGACPSNPT